MNNYELAQENARAHFLSYDSRLLAKAPGVWEQGEYLTFPFLGVMARIEKATGQITFSHDGFLTQWKADFSEALSVYDWLCDRKPEAAASGEFCPVSSLPGVYVSGSGLSMTGGKLPAAIDREPEVFRNACAALGAKRHPLGDIGFVLDIFPGLPMALKFYHGDEDFPPALTLLWDRNILDFVRYETVYYIAGVLIRRIGEKMVSA